MPNESPSDVPSADAQVSDWKLSLRIWIPNTKRFEDPRAYKEREIIPLSLFIHPSSDQTSRHTDTGRSIHHVHQGGFIRQIKRMLTEEAATKLTRACRSFVERKRHVKECATLRSILFKEHHLKLSWTNQRESFFARSNLSLTKLGLSSSHRHQAALVIQSVYRSYSVRNQLQVLGLRLNRPGSAQEEWNQSEKNQAAAIVTLSVSNRQYMHRALLIELYQYYVGMVETAIRKEIDKVSTLIKEESLHVLKKRLPANQYESATAYLSFLEVMKTKAYRSMEQVARECRGIEEKYMCIQDILDFIDSRHAFVTHDVGMLYYKEWMKEEHYRLVRWQTECDVAQESVLEEANLKLVTILESLVSSSEMFHSLLELNLQLLALEGEGRALQYSIDRKEASCEVLNVMNQLDITQKKLKQIKETDVRLTDELRIIYAQEVKEDSLVSNVHRQSDESVVRKEDWIRYHQSLPWLEMQQIQEAKQAVHRKERRKDIETKQRLLQEREDRLEQDRVNADRSIPRLAFLKRQSKSSNIPESKRETFLLAHDELWKALDTFQQTEQDRVAYLTLCKSQLDQDYRMLHRQEEIEAENRTSQKCTIARFAAFEEINIDSTATKSDLTISKMQLEGDIALLRLNGLCANEFCERDATHVNDCTIVWNHLDDDERFTTTIRSSSWLSHIKSRLNRLSKMRFTKNDPELNMLMVSVRKKMLKNGKAISSLHFTIGEEETSAFSEKNMKNEAVGDPFFQHHIDLGKHVRHVLWIQCGIQQRFITDIKLRDKSIISATQDQSSVEVITHDKLPFEMLLTRDTQDSLISEIRISFSQDDETSYAKDCQLVSRTSLSDYSYKLADARLWVYRVSRSAPNRLINPEVLKTEITAYEKMTPMTQSEYALQSNAIRELKQRLEITERSKLKSRDLQADDHESFIMDLLAMSIDEIQLLKKLFEEIDQDEDGVLGVHEIISYIGESKVMIYFMEQVYLLSTDSHHTKGLNLKLTVGQAMRMFMIFASFTKEEVLNFVFRIYDKTNRCKITSDDYLRLLKRIDPKVKVGTTLRALETATLQADGTITLQAFYYLHSRFPSLLFPMFRFQKNIRKNFLGTIWWERKLRKISLAYEKVNQESLNNPSSHS